MLPRPPHSPQLEPKTEWSVLPNLVAKSEWEVNVKDLHRLVDDALRRVNRLEQGKTHDELQLARLSQSCRGLTDVKKGALAKGEERLDLALAALERTWESKLVNFRSDVKAEFEKVQSDMAIEVDRFDKRVDVVNQHFETLEASLQEQAHHAQVTYVEAIFHREDFRQLKAEQQTAERDIWAKLDIMEGLGASKTELGDLQVHLEAEHVSLGNAHEHTARVLDKTCLDLAALKKNSHTALTSCMEKVATSLADTDHQLKLNADSRRTLRAGLDAETQRMDDLAQKHRELSDQMAEWRAGHNGLSSDVSNLGSELNGRCETIMQELKMLDRREKHSWEQFLNRKQEVERPKSRAQSDRT